MKVPHIKSSAAAADPRVKRAEAQAADKVLPILEAFWAKIREGTLPDVVEIDRGTLQLLVMDCQAQRRAANAETGPLSALDMLTLAHDRAVGSTDALVSVVRALAEQVRWLSHIINASGILNGPELVALSEQVRLLREAAISAGVVPAESFAYQASEAETRASNVAAEQAAEDTTPKTEAKIHGEG